jgi:hypothetical protein
MSSNKSAPSRRDTLRISSVERPGWSTGGEGHVPPVGERVYCTEGEAEVVRVLGRTSDGSRLLELRLTGGPKTPFFASSSNVLQRCGEQATDSVPGGHDVVLGEQVLGGSLRDLMDSGRH